MVLTGWRAVVLTILGVVLLVALAILFFWVALALAALLGLAALHLVYLPRLSARLGIRPIVAGALLLPVLLLSGWLLGGNLEGMLTGALIWLGGVAMPRLALWYLARRLHVRMDTWISGTRQATGRGSAPEQELVGVACPRCGLISFPPIGGDHAACPRCGAPLVPSLREPE